MFDSDDAPDPDQMYRNYLETCRRLGVEPVPRERAHEFIAEWADANRRGAKCLRSTLELGGCLSRSVACNCA